MSAFRRRRHKDTQPALLLPFHMSLSSSSPSWCARLPWSAIRSSEAGDNASTRSTSQSEQRVKPWRYSALHWGQNIVARSSWWGGFGDFADDFAGAGFVGGGDVDVGLALWGL